MNSPTENPQTKIIELIKLFLKLGFTAFGGPAAHIAMLRQEVVVNRKWIEEEEFLDLIGATNLIPGPNSTEMVLHVGYLRAGYIGLLAAGISFILPAMSLVMIFAWLYKGFGTTPEADSLLYGVKPVIIAVIIQALWGLGKKALKDPITIITGFAVIALYFLGVHELLLLAAGGLTVMVFRNLNKIKGAVFSFLPFLISIPTQMNNSLSKFSLPVLFLTFLKTGAVLYGSGYVLLAFLKRDLVERLGWLTDQQLIDAIAVGQITPGPVFTTATFIGFLLGDLSGALAATIGIFLPAFVLVGITNPLIPKLRKSTWTSGILDGVNAAALGLMAAVTWQLGRAALIDPFTIVLAVLAGILIFGMNLKSHWLVLIGALVGILKAVFF